MLNLHDSEYLGQTEEEKTLFQKVIQDDPTMDYNEILGWLTEVLGPEKIREQLKDWGELPQ
jgi:hypothetical protein